MLSDAIKKKEILYDGYVDAINIEELIETFATSGVAEFKYKGQIWHVRDEYNPKHEWVPGIGLDINGENGWQFFDTWDDLVEKFKFPDGKTMLEVVFTKQKD